MGTLKQGNDCTRYNHRKDVLHEKRTMSLGLLGEWPNSVGVSLCGHPLQLEIAQLRIKRGAHRGTPLQN